MIDKTTEDMRKELLIAYPRGIIRNQFILQMPPSQIYAIYKWHIKNDISMKKPREKKTVKQIPGQQTLF